MVDNELRQSWLSHNPDRLPAKFAGWLSCRVNKRLARWTGKPQKRTTRLFWGQPMTVVFPEFVSTKIVRQGYFEPELTALFLDVVRPGMVVYDVGAHFGYFSLLASALVGQSGRVIALEPTPETYHVLAENAARQPNIACHNLAAYRTTGQLSFWQQAVKSSSLNFVIAEQDKVEDQHMQPGGQMLTVEAVQLDAFAKEHGDPDFIKLDAEGAEGPILEGMTELIERSHPAISLEVGDLINQRTGNPMSRDNVNWLLDRDYQAYDYKSGQAQPHNPLEHYEYNNLLFRHPAERK